jgi:hypothetical protein
MKKVKRKEEKKKKKRRKKKKKRKIELTRLFYFPYLRQGHQFDHVSREVPHLIFSPLH